MHDTARLPELITSPAVFAIGDEYQIIAPASSPILFWIEVNGKKYYDHSNGVIRSSFAIHRVSIPTAELDGARSYTVGYRKIIERKPYFSQVEEPVSATYKFRPVPTEGKINIYQVADNHGEFDIPMNAARLFGESLDLLLLNGDTFNDSNDPNGLLLLYRICDELTGGERTCVFSRGNHDTRGERAEIVADYTPTKNGRSYYTFRAGCVWGIVLDCAEDKADDHPEYGFTNCCHEFRLEESEYLREVIANADREYAAPGVKYRLVVAHHPFTHILNAPFDIEQDIYRDWASLLGEHVKPDLLLSGHLHSLHYSPIGGKFDNGIGQMCPVLVGSRPIYNDKHKMLGYIGCALTLEDGRISWSFTDDKKETVENGVIEP